MSLQELDLIAHLIARTKDGSLIWSNDRFTSKIIFGNDTFYHVRVPNDPNTQITIYRHGLFHSHKLYLDCRLVSTDKTLLKPLFDLIHNRRVKVIEKQATLNDLLEKVTRAFQNCKVATF